MLSHYRKTVQDEIKTVIWAGLEKIDVSQLGERPNQWVHDFNRVLGNGPTLSETARQQEEDRPKNISQSNKQYLY